MSAVIAQSTLSAAALLLTLPGEFLAAVLALVLHCVDFHLDFLSYLDSFAKSVEPSITIFDDRCE